MGDVACPVSLAQLFPVCGGHGVHVEEVGEHWCGQLHREFEERCLSVLCADDAELVQRNVETAGLDRQSRQLSREQPSPFRWLH